MEKLTMTQIRRMLGLTQEDFGEKIGLNRVAIQRREKGEVSWKMEEVKRVCDTFKIDTSILSLEK